MAARRQHIEGALLRHTRELLSGSSQVYADIFRATNITPDWLHRFATGKIRDPGVNRVEVLYRHLCKTHPDNIPPFMDL